MGTREQQVKRLIESAMRTMETLDHTLDMISEELEPILLMCNRPDRDAPGLVCGYPLPCPYHTITIDTTSEPVATITIPTTALSIKSLRVLKEVAIAVSTSTKTQEG